MEATNLAELYHSPLLDWAPIEARLRAGLSQAPGTGGPDRHTCWLATIRSRRRQLLRVPAIAVTARVSRAGPGWPARFRSAPFSTGQTSLSAPSPGNPRPYPV